MPNHNRHTLLWDFLSETSGLKMPFQTDIVKKIDSLHRTFTEDRRSLAEFSYFSKPANLKAYLAYFVPLNVHKLFAIFDAHGKHLEARTIRSVLDFGCGPGTATIAFLCHFGEELTGKFVDFYLVDQQKEALELAQKLIAQLCDEFAITPTFHIHQNLEKIKNVKFDLSFCVNVLNELPEEDTTSFQTVLEQTRKHFIILEPSHRVSSQRLIRFRERARKFNPQISFAGPCLHAEKCPIVRTQHWCHFSESLLDEHLIELNRLCFGKPRLWLKFSYLWILGPDVKPAQAPQPGTYRTIGDLHPAGPQSFAVDLCQPEEKLVFRQHKRAFSKIVQQKLQRGCIVEIDPVPSKEDSKKEVIGGESIEAAKIFVRPFRESFKN